MKRAALSKPARFARTAVLLGLLSGCGSASNPAPDGHARNAGAGEAGEGAGAEPDAGAGGNAEAPGAGDAGNHAAGEGVGLGGPESQGGAAGAESVLAPGPAYASRVQSFTPGPGAGYNQAELPSVVLGPPQGEGTGSGSLDVVSLGAGGEIVLGFGALGIVDGPGPDLIVFENAFWPGGDPTSVFYELGEVSVSEDGETWHRFACDRAGDGQGNFPGCAGFTPTLEYDATTLVPLDPTQSGGDAFDLADLGLQHARFVRIHDLETLPPGGTTSGFDLDAVAAIHAR